MSTTAMLNEGVVLMILGMGTVFLFLALQVSTMRLVSVVAGRFDATSANEDPTPPCEDDIPIAAIGAAVRQFRARHARSFRSSTP